MKDKIILVFRFILNIIAVGCFLWYVLYSIGLQKESHRYEEIRKIVEVEMVENDNGTKDIKSKETNKELNKENFKETQTELKDNTYNIIMSDDYSELRKINEDIVGWIKNDDKIDYPIMQSKESSDYYIHRDIDKKYSYSGSLYIPKNDDINEKYVLIHGHHMRNTTMFGTLEKYLRRDFFKRHRRFKISNLESVKEYEVLCVFIGKVYDNKFGPFEYYNYRGNLTKDEFKEYKEGVSKLVRVGDISSLSYEDNVVQLSTCWYTSSQDRLVVVLREIK